MPSNKRAARTSLLATVHNRDRQASAILDTIVEGVITINEEGLILSTNPAVAKIFDYPHGSLIGQSLDTLVGQAAAGKHATHISRYIREDSTNIIGFTREVLGKKRDGQLVPLELAVTEIRANGERVFTGVVRDISERKRAEAAIQLKIKQQTAIAHLSRLALSARGFSPVFQAIDKQISEIANVNRVICGQFEPHTGELRLHGKARSIEAWFDFDLLSALASNLAAGAHQFYQNENFSVALVSTTKRTIIFVAAGSSDNPIAKDDLDFLLSSSAYILAEFHERKLTEDILQATLENLEQGIEERTNELAHSVQVLRGEIHERGLVEQRLANSLQEKEVLLKEIHHRVKNNLQIISSVVSLQLRRHTTDNTSKLALIEVQDRVRAIALIHQMLYSSENVSRIDFKKYVNNLTSQLIRYHGRSSNVSFVVEANDVQLTLDESITCGMVACELIINSLKHAFPDNRAGGIFISLCKSETDEVEFSVKDNGVGCSEIVRHANAQTIGLGLVERFAERLNAKLSIDSSSGTEVKMRFRSKFQ